MRNGFLVLGVSLAISACSSEQLNRTTFGALHEQQRWQCLQEGRRDCPPPSSYDEYQRERDAEIKHDGSHPELP